MVDDGRSFKALDEKRMKSAMMAWTMILGGGATVVIVLVVIFWLMPHLERRDRVAATVPNVEDFVALEETIESTKLDKSEAVALVKKAMTARTEEEVSEVIEPGSESLASVIKFLSDGDERDGEITGYGWVERLDNQRDDMVGVVVSTEKDGQKGNRIALLARDLDNEWKMDFAAFARLATPSWDEFLTGDAEQTIARVYVQKDYYFNGPFSEADGWICCGVASPDVDKLMFGYCKGDSAQAKALRSLLRNKNMARATVALEKVEGADSRQFVIKRVLAEDWMIGDEAADAIAE